MPRRCPKQEMFILTVTLGMVLSITASSRAGETVEYQKLLNDKVPSLVTVKFVLQAKMGGIMGDLGEEESETEITGVLIEPSGLVLCSNTQLSGFVGLMARFLNAEDGTITATPTDLKVLIGEDAEGRAAELLARDSELDLAWVKIKEPGDKPLPYVDFGKAAKPNIGQPILAVRRLDKYFARTPVVLESKVAGITAKPRDLYVPSMNVALAHGVPVYTADGQVIGVTVFQWPDREDVQANPMALLTQMQDMMSAFILPAAEVVKATRRALESAEKKGP